MSWLRRLLSCTLLILVGATASFAQSSPSGRGNVVPLLRFEDQGDGRHVFMTVPAGAQVDFRQGLVRQAATTFWDSPLFYLYREGTASMVPVQRLVEPGGEFSVLAGTPAEVSFWLSAGWQTTEVLGYVYPSIVEGSSEVFHLRNEVLRDSIYTTSVEERDYYLSIQGWGQRPSLGFTQPESSLGTAVLAPTTVSLSDEEALALLSRIDPTGRFVIDLPSRLGGLQPGHVLYAARSVRLPDGFFRRVDAVEEESGQLWVRHSMASLAEAFSEVHLFADNRPVWRVPAGVVDPRTGERPLVSADGAVSSGQTIDYRDLELPDPRGSRPAYLQARALRVQHDCLDESPGCTSSWTAVVVPMDIELSAKDRTDPQLTVTVAAAGTLSVTGRFSIYYAPDPSRLEFHFIPEARVDLEVEATGEMELLKKEVPLPDLPVSFVVGGLPVVGRFSADVALEAAVSGAARLQATAVRGVDIGIRYNMPNQSASGWDPFVQPFASTVTERSSGLKGRLTLFAEPKLTISLGASVAGVSGEVGVFGAVKVFLEVRADTKLSAFDLYWGIQPRVGVEARVWKIETELASHAFARHEEHLASTVSPRQLTIVGPQQVKPGTSTRLTGDVTWSNGLKSTVSPITWTIVGTKVVIDSNGFIHVDKDAVSQRLTVTGKYERLGSSITSESKYVQVIGGKTADKLEILGASSVDETKNTTLSGRLTWSDGTTTTVTPAWSATGASATISSLGVLTAREVSATTPVTVTAKHLGLTATKKVDIVDRTPTLSVLDIEGPASFDATGGGATYRAVARYADGTKRSVRPTWSVSPSSTASISQDGLLRPASATAAGTVTVGASYSEAGRSVSASKTVTIAARRPVSLSISGPSSVARSSTANFTAAVRWSDGTSSGVTPSWTENSTSTTISAGGVLTTGAVDRTVTVKVTASYSSGGVTVTGDKDVAVVAPTLNKLVVSGAATVDEGKTTSLTARATYADGRTATVTPTWSDNSSVLSVAANGTATATSVTTDQKVVVTATFTEGGVTKVATHDITVRNVQAALSSVAIEGPATVDEGGTIQLTAVQTFADATTTRASAGCTWSRSAPTVSVATTGRVTAASVTSDQPVTVTLSCTIGGVTKTATKTITVKNVQVPGSLAIVGPASVNENSTAAYTARVTWQDGTSATVTPAWQEDGAATTISSTGVLTAGSVTADATVTLTATYAVNGRSVTATAKVKVINIRTLSGLSIGGNTSVDEGAAITLTASATWSDGTSSTVQPSWSDNSSALSVSASGVATAGSVSANQSATVTATYTSGGVTRTATRVITIVNVPVLTALAIEGATSVNEGSSVSLTARASWDNGTTSLVTPSWSDNSSAVSVSGSGVVTASSVSADTNVTVTATYTSRGVTKSATRVIKVVNGRTLTGLTINGPSSVNENSTASFTARASWSDGTSSDVTPVWSENSTFTTISGSGVLTASAVTANRTVSVSAAYTHGGITKSASKTVTVVNR